ncbi:phosphate regulon sensor histidine kinase PhoR [Dasania sp. GY-MA-18]|uniref:Phosphate regulon sensor protein PhoR n=1 Tax=Dasania phycosphaerae TaxID=2950436 RepID=A0A9J6RMB6_9GAMM|nr:MULTISPECIES: phosphate regulon sensor histidine kinase PhoR [Dasania]MCR8922896.1 phosphate regulon sensor histidine kinase PhoR [Dasania sp. GY-MA-18]MCZ0865327.1 phosphate regulon sensor histidine kinase PhoR [Dasania phycosphaerae]MCZ0869052.1 phosphate regulon sensor histidine kinase PhoR [Dasania phycosphaerae]
MQRINWMVELKQLAQLFTVALVLGWLAGHLLLALLLAALLYIAGTFRQLLRVQRWLIAEDGSDPPESTGLWGDMLDGIYRLQRQNREERQRLQGAVDYLRDSLASLGDAAVMIDQNGNIEWCNLAARRLLGLRHPEDAGQQLVNLIRSPEFIHYYEANEYQTPLEIASPHQLDKQLQFQLTFFGRGSRLMFARDITHTHRLQEMRKDFVGNVSHELRTPLTVVNGYLETFVDSEIASAPRYKRAFQQMLEQVRRMENLIKDLIVLTRLETVPDEGEHAVVVVCPLLRQIREEVLAVFNQQRLIELDCDERLSLRGEAEALRSAFTNLVMNAAKYSNDNGKIQVRWYVDGDKACLQVSDNGLGIEAHHIPRLTERFYRVDKSRSTQTGGTGLGLAIVKHVLLRHHGELKITSTVGQGSSFACYFPLSQCQLKQS